LDLLLDVGIRHIQFRSQVNYAMRFTIDSLIEGTRWFISRSIQGHSQRA